MLFNLLNEFSFFLKEISLDNKLFLSESKLLFNNILFLLTTTSKLFSSTLNKYASPIIVPIAILSSKISIEFMQSPGIMG